MPLSAYAREKDGFPKWCHILIVSRFIFNKNSVCRPCNLLRDIKIMDGYLQHGNKYTDIFTVRSPPLKSGQTLFCAFWGNRAIYMRSEAVSIQYAALVLHGNWISVKITDECDNIIRKSKKNSSLSKDWSPMDKFQWKWKEILGVRQIKKLQG